MAGEVFNRKDRVTFRGRSGTVDYWCPSMAHIHFDDDPRHVTVIGAENLAEILRGAKQ